MSDKQLKFKSKECVIYTPVIRFKKYLEEQLEVTIEYKDELKEGVGLDSVEVEVTNKRTGTVIADFVTATIFDDEVILGIKAQETGVEVGQYYQIKLETTFDDLLPTVRINYLDFRIEPKPSKTD